MPLLTLQELTEQNLAAHNQQTYMAGKNKKGFNDEACKAKDVDSTQHTNETARERFATGTNSTSRYKTKQKSFGKLGSKGLPD